MGDIQTPRTPSFPQGTRCWEKKQCSGGGRGGEMKMAAKSPTAIVRLLDSVWGLISSLSERKGLQLMLILTLTQLWTVFGGSQ